MSHGLTVTKGGKRISIDQRPYDMNEPLHEYYSNFCESLSAILLFAFVLFGFLKSVFYSIDKIKEALRK